MEASIPGNSVSFRLIAKTQVELDLSQASDVFLVLTLTYPRYIDVASRSAVLEVLCALTRRDVSYTNGTKNNLSGLVEWISKWINNESARICSPATRKLRQLPPTLNLAESGLLARRLPANISFLLPGVVLFLTSLWRASQRSRKRLRGPASSCLWLASLILYVVPHRNIPSNIAPSCRSVDCSAGYAYPDDEGFDNLKIISRS